MTRHVNDAKVLTIACGLENYLFEILDKMHQFCQNSVIREIFDIL
jgi:hypothetical protein